LYGQKKKAPFFFVCFIVESRGPGRESGGTVSSSNEKRWEEEWLEKYIDQQTRFVSQAAWFSRSIDCQNLTGKKAVVFGDGTHAASMTKILAREMGIRVSCAGTYCRQDADWFREQVDGL
jgi:light-independent protochlorophyllide reductase subunit B